MSKLAILCALITIAFAGAGVSQTCSDLSGGGPSATFGQPGYVANEPSTSCPGMGVLTQGAGIGQGPGPLAGSGAGPSSVAGMPMPAIAVDDTAVYVVRGNQLLKFNKTTLELMSNTSLQGAVTTPPGSTPPSSATTPSTSGKGPSANPDAAAASREVPPETITVDRSGQAASGRGHPETTSAPRAEIQSRIRRIGRMAPSTMEQSYLQNMYQAHLGSIAWSKLAATKAQLPQLRSFAKKIVSRESSLNSKLAGWAKSWYCTTPPNVPMAIDTDELNKLQSLSGKQFDLEYARAMITSLTEAVDMSQLVIGKTVHPALRAAMSNMINAHTRERQQLRMIVANHLGS